MRTRIAFVLIVAFSIIGFMNSCVNNNVAETDELYDVHSVDKEKIERPGNQGGD